MPDPTTVMSDRQFPPEVLAAVGLTADQAEIWLRSNGVDPVDIADDELLYQVQLARDMQEAGSRKYGNDCVILLPLKSGNFAAFGIDRQDVTVVGPKEINDATLRDLTQHFASSVRERSVHVSRLRDLSVDEPNARQLAKDIRNGHRTKRPPLPSGGVEVDLDEI